jgi:hypothetical protein
LAQLLARHGAFLTLSFDTVSSAPQRSVTSGCGAPPTSADTRTDSGAPRGAETARASAEPEPEIHGVDPESGSALRL